MMFILDVYSSFYIVWSCLCCFILNFDIQTVFYKYAHYANFPGLIIKLSFNAPENPGQHISENSTHFLFAGFSLPRTKLRLRPSEGVV